MIPQAGLESSFGLLMCPSILLWALEGLWAPMTFGFSLGLVNGMKQLGREVGVGGEREKEVGGLLLVSLNLGRPQVAAVLLSEPLYTDALSDFSGVSSNWSLQTWIFSLVLSLSPSHLF